MTSEGRINGEVADHDPERVGELRFDPAFWMTTASSISSYGATVFGFGLIVLASGNYYDTLTNWLYRGNIVESNIGEMIFPQRVYAFNYEALMVTIVMIAVGVLGLVVGVRSFKKGAKRAFFVDLWWVGIAVYCIFNNAPYLTMASSMFLVLALMAQLTS